MRYNIIQIVTLVDMNNEFILEVPFDHGEFESLAFSIGSTVITHDLGLQDFTVVYDKRKGKISRYKVVDIEINLLNRDKITKGFLEPITLILGQHDIGQVNFHL